MFGTGKKSETVKDAVAFAHDYGVAMIVTP